MSQFYLVSSFTIVWLMIPQYRQYIDVTFHTVLVLLLKGLSTLAGSSIYSTVTSKLLVRVGKWFHQALPTACHAQQCATARHMDPLPGCMSARLWLGWQVLPCGHKFVCSVGLARWRAEPAALCLLMWTEPKEQYFMVCSFHLLMWQTEVLPSD